jgi:spore coat polysaccharide biosynthesis protein SpsF (cytidylyltransferase family)
MEVEALSVDALADADRRCTAGTTREHGSLYIRRNPQSYRLLNLEAPGQLRRPDLELEVDTEIDLQVMEAILGYFGGRMDFTLREIIEFLDAHPSVAELNRTVHRRWRDHRLESPPMANAGTES